MDLILAYYHRALCDPFHAHTREFPFVSNAESSQRTLNATPRRRQVASADHGVL